MEPAAKAAWSAQGRGISSKLMIFEYLAMKGEGMKFPLKFLFLMISIFIVFLSVKAGDYNTDGSLTGSSESPETGQVNANGSIIALPITMWPSTEHPISIFLGDVFPGETKDFIPFFPGNSSYFTVTGQPTYQVQLNWDIKTMYKDVLGEYGIDGLTLGIDWYIAEDFSSIGAPITNIIDGSNRYWTISDTQDFTIYFTIKSMIAANGAPVGTRVFYYKISCTYFDGP